MYTLADLLANADRGSHNGTYVDDTTPAGHFILDATVVGLTTTYLLAGDLDDPDALVVGRIERHPTADMAHSTTAVYRGSGLKGGALLPTSPEGDRGNFAAIINN